MSEKKEGQKNFSTCMENVPFAEMMQKMMGKKGIGSLCAEMMKKVTEKQGGGCGVQCAEMMKSMMKPGDDANQEQKETKKEA